MCARRLMGLFTAATVASAALIMGPFSTAAARDPYAIWVLGDSVSTGYTGPSAKTRGRTNLTQLQLSTPGGYRSFLDTRLTELGVAHRFIGTLNTNPPREVHNESDRHDGHVGFWVELLDMGLSGPDDFAVTGGGDGGGHWLTGTSTRPGLSPDVVVLQAGVADTVIGRDPIGVYPGYTYDRADPTQRAVFVAHLIDRYRWLIRNIHHLRPHTRIVLSTLTPIGGIRDTDKTALAVNAGMRDHLVPEFREAGVEIVLADIDAALRAKPGLLADDAIHPTEEGYAAVGVAIGDAVHDVLRMD